MEDPAMCSHGEYLLDRCYKCIGDARIKGYAAGMEEAAVICEQQIYANMCCGVVLEEATADIRAAATERPSEENKP